MILSGTKMSWLCVHANWRKELATLYITVQILQLGTSQKALLCILKKAGLGHGKSHCWNVDWLDSFMIVFCMEPTASGLSLEGENRPKGVYSLATKGVVILSAKNESFYPQATSHQAIVGEPPGVALLFSWWREGT